MNIFSQTKVEDQAWYQVNNRFSDQFQIRLADHVSHRVLGLVSCGVWKKIINQVRAPIRDQVRDQIRTPRI